MTQDVSTPDESNPAGEPQVPEQAAHIMDQVPETQTIAASDVGSLSAVLGTPSEQAAPPPVSNEFVAPGAEQAAEPEETIAQEGLALLQTTVRAIESEAHKIVTAIEHSIVPAGVGPRTVEAAQNLPFAAPGETLFEAGEHLLFRAFRDVGDEVRHIYLNEFGNHVKA